MKYIVYSLKIFTILVSLYTIYHILYTRESLAITMSNDDYILQTELNSAGGSVKNDSYKLDTSVGQTVAGNPQSTYKAFLGFQYLRSSTAFVFSVSDSFLDFGLLTPANPVTRTNTLSVSPGTTNGYTVVVSQDHPLTGENNAFTIPDTTCDSGTCNFQTAGAWKNILTYGFGYRCDNVKGNDCDKSFATSDLYKPFANTSKNNKPSVVMSGSSGQTIKSAKITYKVNISTTQPAASYSNTITFVASPTF